MHGPAPAHVSMGDLLVRRLGGVRALRVAGLLARAVPLPLAVLARDLPLTGS